MFRLAATSLATVLATAIALPAMAQELLPRYTIMGTATVTVDGTEHSLVIPYDTENDSAYAAERNIMGRRSVNLLARTVNDDGIPGSPMLQLTFWVDNGTGDFLSAEFFGEDMNTPLAAGSDGGTVAFGNFSISDDNEISADFSGEFVRMENYMSESAIAPGTDPVPISGTFSVTVPKPE